MPRIEAQRIGGGAMSLDDFSSLDSPLSHRDTLPSDLPDLTAAAQRRLTNEYHFCQRCWMPLAPVRRCRCAPEPYPENATPARVVAEHPAIKRIAAAVAAGRYADDTATREERWLAWLLWLLERGQCDEWQVAGAPALEAQEEDAR